jgi:hypothetical protein
MSPAYSSGKAYWFSINNQQDELPYVLSRLMLSCADSLLLLHISSHNMHETRGYVVAESLLPPQDNISDMRWIACLVVSSQPQSYLTDDVPMLDLLIGLSVLPMESS